MSDGILTAMRRRRMLSPNLVEHMPRDANELLYGTLDLLGRQLMRAEVATWKRYVAAVSSVIEPA
jgi:hypothetical protein